MLGTCLYAAEDGANGFESIPHGIFAGLSALGFRMCIIYKLIILLKLQGVNEHSILILVLRAARRYIVRNIA